MNRAISIVSAGLVFCTLVNFTRSAAADEEIDANRLTFIDAFNDPYGPNHTWAKLTTPQWVGDKDIDVAVFFAIDDMSDHGGYENYLRPILERLKKIDGRAPVSIMSNRPNPNEPHLQAWLNEGVTIETHTFTHPCPLLSGGDFTASKHNYDRCVEHVAQIPNWQPVGFRMTCFDSINNSAPRFYSEIFNKHTPEGLFLKNSSSMCMLFTEDDPEQPAGYATDDDGRAKFGKYMGGTSLQGAANRTYVNYIENYPFPYIIGRLCWELPSIVPDDWQGQHLHGNHNPQTVADMKSAFDAAARKHGFFAPTFHPYSWIKNTQMVEIVDHIVETKGDRAIFLNMKEIDDRITEHLLAGQPIRHPKTGQDNGVRVLDLNADGYMDVVIGNAQKQLTRVWEPESRQWHESDFPALIVQADSDGNAHDSGVRFGIVTADCNAPNKWTGHATVIVRNESQSGGWHFDGRKWVRNDKLLAGLEIDGAPIMTAESGKDRGVRLRDIYNDGQCELIVANDSQNAVYQWLACRQTWSRLSLALPDATRLVNEQGGDAGVRFVDVNEDGYDDVLFSDADRYGLYLWNGNDQGWSKTALQGKRGGNDASKEIPMVVRADGTNNGVWFAKRHMFVQNEDTADMPDHIDRRSFDDLLRNVPPSAQDAATSLGMIELNDDRFEVQLVAAEPLVKDPVAFDWGPDGRLWVVEMADYPLGLDDQGQPGGRVRFLEDTNGDGEYDKSTLFAESIPFPTDVLVWRQGVLVTAAPNIWYLEDSNGDGKADIKKSIFAGFGEGNQQHRVNGLRWGLDNWVYVANGDSGGMIKSAKTGDEVNISGRDLRIDPDSGAIEAVTGGTQHGRGRDDWGNWWGANNSFPMFQFVLEDAYLFRNPFVAPPNPRINVSTLDDSPIYPISRVMSHFSGYQPPAPGQPSRFTSACGTIVYRDSLLGDDIYGNMFVSAPVHNLVHRRVIEWNGVTMTSRKPEEEVGSEFLRSRDSWFRPTMLRTGPDGGIYVADMYRLVIEHPEWIADDLEDTLELRAGHDKGRIYRVVPRDKRKRDVPRLDRMTTQQLVQTLAGPNGFQRDLAHRMLLWRDKQDDVQSLLETAATDGNTALQRLHALCVLDGMGAVSAKVIIAAIRDESPGVRRHAVRISEQFAGQPAQSDVLSAIKTLADKEQDALVIKQIAYSLGEFDDASAGHAIGGLLAEHGGDQYIAAAGVSSATKRTADVLAGLRETEPPDATMAQLTESLVRTALSKNDEQTVRAIMTEIIADEGDGYAAWQFSALAGIDQALGAEGRSLNDILDNDAEIRKLHGIRSAARAVATNDEATDGFRGVALQLLGHDSATAEEDVKTLVALLSSQTPLDLQQRAVDALSNLRGESAAKAIIANWDDFGPLVRERMIGIMLRRTQSTWALIKAVESQKIDRSDINATYRQVLINHADEPIRSAAVTLLGMKIDGERQKLIDDYLPKVKVAKADARRGLERFTQACMQCHQVGSYGHGVGPNLAGLVDKSPEFLTAHILDPNRAIEDKYLNYTLETIDGESFTGLLQSETGTSVTLLGLSGESNTILKKEIEPGTLKRSTQSMMPLGLEAFLDPQGLADVIAFINENQEQPKQFDGNEPKLVEADASLKALRLQAANAEIYGDTLVYESHYGNLGYWASANDRAMWTVNVPTSGKYDVYLDWAVWQDTADNPYVLEVVGEKLSGRVESTGTWDDYKQRKIGTLNLKQGSQRIAFKPVGKPSNCLIDLREICLVPAGRQPPKHFLPDEGMPKPKRVDGNEPTVIKPSQDGSIALFAATAELYGSQIAIYEPQRCIGWWTRQSDYVIWRIKGAKAGTYDVQLEWSIPDNMAGNTFEVVNTTNNARFDETIPTTGGFEHYRKKVFGQIQLREGDNVIRVQPITDIKGELADLRGIVLKPTATQK